LRRARLWPPRRGLPARTGSGNTISNGTAGTLATETSATYAPPTTGTAATNSVSGAHTVLVTLYASFTQSTVQDGCGMSFIASNGATAASGVSLAAGNDDHSVVHGNLGPSSGDKKYGASGSFVVTTAAGTTTFTAVYRQLSGGSCTIAAGHSIIVQVY
jgi:hypothetical protein